MLSPQRLLVRRGALSAALPRLPLPLPAAPSRGIHARAGGTISLGDTIDATALLYSLKTDRPPKPLHPSSF